MISVLAPLYNEEKNVPILVERLISVLKQLQKPFEIILVNDCSDDSTFDQLYRAAQQHPEIKVINLKRRSGQTAAMMAGIKYASGSIIVPMDGDLQNDPTDIPRLIAKLEEGYDVVSGWRKNRKDKTIRRKFLSMLANKLISWLTGIKLHDYGCSLKAYRREVIKNVKLYGEMHRFIPIYASWYGGRVTELPVQHHPRIHGKSKYGLERIFKVMLDLLLIKFMDKYFTKPIYVFGGFGIVCFILGLVVGIIALYLKFFHGTSMIQTPLPLLSVTLAVVGTMNVLMGLLAEIIIRTYFESQNKDIYNIGSTLNIETEEHLTEPLNFARVPQCVE